MAVDVSTLSIKVVSSGIDDSTAKLDKLSTTADKAEVATKKFSTSSSSSYQAVSKELQNLQRVANTTSIVPSSSGTAKAVAEVKVATQAITQSMMSVGTASKQVEKDAVNAFQAIGGSISSLRTLLGGGLIMGAIINISGAVIEMADSYKLAQARLTQVTGSFENAVKAQKDLVNVALDLHVPLQGISQLFTRLVPAMKTYGYTSKDALDVTKAMSAALKMSGATGAEASSVMLQFSQSMAAGRLNGAEFNAVAEGAPVVLRALETALHKTRGELKQMGADGKLTTDLIVEALKGKLPEWEKAVGSLPITFEAAMQDLKTSLTVAIGEMDSKGGFTNKLAAGIELLAKSIGTIVTLLEVGAISALSYFTAKMVVATAATVSNNLALGYGVINTEALAAAQLAEAEANVIAARATLKHTQDVGASYTVKMQATAATTELALAEERLAVAQAGVVTKTSLLSSALGFLTSPIGIITGLLTVGALAWLNWGDSADDAISRSQKRMQDIKDLKIAASAADVDESRNLAMVANTQLKEALAAQKQAEAIRKQSSGPLKDVVSPSELMYKEKAEQAKKDRDFFAKRLQDAQSAAGEQQQQKAASYISTLTKPLDTAPGYTKKKNEIESIMARALAQKEAGKISESAFRGITEQVKIATEANEKHNPTVVAAAEEERKRTKELRASQAAQAKQTANTNALTAAQNSYSNALQSINDFSDKQKKLDLEHINLLEDIHAKTNQEVADINQKTQALQMERDGVILTSAAKIAGDIKEREALALSIKAKQDNIQADLDSRDVTLEVAKQRMKAAEDQIILIGVAKDANQKQAMEQAKNDLTKYQAEVEYQEAKRRGLSEEEARIERLKKLNAADLIRQQTQAMLDMERVGRSLGETLADSFGKVGKSLSELIITYQEFTKQEKILKDNKEKSGNTDKANAEYARASSMLQAKAYGDMAKSAKNFFKENTTGYKVLNAAEKAFRTYEMLMAAKSFAQKMALSDNEMVAIAAKNALALAGIAAEKTAQLGLNIIRAIGAIITQGSAGPIIGFAAMAAMAAAVIALGVSVGGSGGQAPTSAKQLQEQAGTGSVFGDLTAKSESISKSMEMLTENTGLSAEYNAGMLASLRNIEASMTGFTSVILRSGFISGISGVGMESGNVGSDFWKKTSDEVDLASKYDPISAWAGGYINKWIGGFLGKITGGKTTVEDFGITSGKQSLGSIASGGLMSQGYTNIKKSGGWFSKDKYSTVLSDLPQEVSAQFSMVVNNMRDGVLQAGRVLGMGSGFAGKLDKFVVDIGNISLKGLSAEEIQKQFSNIFSKLGDDLAKFGFGEEFLAKYQKVGEGAFETLIRVASAIATVDGLFLNLGIDVSSAFDSISMSGVDAKMQLIEFAGGLDKLASSLGAYYDKYYTDAEKQKIVADQVGAKLASMGLNVVAGADEAATLANFRKLVEQQNLGTESGRRAYAALLEVAPTFADLADKLAAGELLGVGQTIPQAQMDAANAWWEAKGGPAAVDTQQVIANGITTLNDLGAKDKTIAAMATQNAADTAATIQTLREMVAAQQTTNNILMAKIDSLTAAVSDAGKKTVAAVTDTASNITR